MRKMARYNPVLEDIPSEHVEQREFVSWFKQTYRPVRIFAIPNGGKRGKAEALRLKCEGVSPGVPDLFIPEWGLWIEMKRQKGGRVDEDQKSWHNYLRENFYEVLICKGCEAAKKAIRSFAEKEMSKV